MNIVKLSVLRKLLKCCDWLPYSTIVQIMLALMLFDEAASGQSIFAAGITAFREAAVFQIV